MSGPENGSVSALLGSEGQPGPRRSGYSIGPAESSTATLEQSDEAPPHRAVGARSTARSRAGLREVRHSENAVLETSLFFGRYMQSHH